MGDNKIQIAIDFDIFKKQIRYEKVVDIKLYCMCFNWQKINKLCQSTQNGNSIDFYHILLNFSHQKVSPIGIGFDAIPLDTSEISLAYFIVGIDKNTYETMQWQY